MAHLFAQVVLKHISGMPRDNVVNTFHFSTASANDAAAQEVETMVRNFYNQEANAGFPGTRVSYWLSPLISRAANDCKIKIYDWDLNPPPGDPNAPPNTPLREAFFTLGASSDSNSLPEEVALCLSYYAGANTPRRRGRIFIGPLVRNAVAGGSGQPSSDIVTGLLERGMDTAQGNLVTKWSVWSKRDQALRGITNLWVDNAFDTQRRRGQRSTFRETRTVPAA